MSMFIELYVVDEAKLTMQPRSDYSERYRHLVKEVRAFGARWEEIEGRCVFDAFEAVDEQIGAQKFLLHSAINNSPHNVLGNGANWFGYFSPSAAGDLAALLGRVSDATIAALEGQVPLSWRTYWAFRESAEEAVRRKHGIAVLVDAPR
jgi:hypothetical protein